MKTTIALLVSLFAMTLSCGVTEADALQDAVTTADQFRQDGDDGVAKDPAEAVKWFRKAAEQGQAGAQDSLGVRHADDDGVESRSKPVLEE